MKSTEGKLLKIGLLIIAAVALISGCIAAGGVMAGDSTKVVRPVGGLRLDAVNLKEGVLIYNERGTVVAARGSLSLRNVSHSSYPGRERGLPKSIRATWREGKFRTKGGGVGTDWEGGTIVGDYTVPVADRVPEEVWEYIRQNGGALRLKIRLMDDRVLIGWDIEKSLPIPNCTPRPGGVCTAVHWFNPGGDFREAKIYNGKVVEKGWYIEKETGRKIETDY